MKGFLVQLYEGTSSDHSFLDAAGNAKELLALRPAAHGERRTREKWQSSRSGNFPPLPGDSTIPAN